MTNKEKDKDKEKFALIGAMSAYAANFSLEEARRASDIVYGMKMFKEMHDIQKADGGNDKKKGA